MAKIRADYVFGTTDTALTTSSTTLSSPTLTRLPVVASPDTAAITLHDSTAGTYEIVYVTAHAASATTATITRAQEGSTAKSWASGATWLHGPTSADFTGSSSRVLLKTVTLSAAGLISFTSADIPTSGFNHLEIRVNGRGTGNSSSNAQVTLAANGDNTVANYFYKMMYATTGLGADSGSTNYVGWTGAGAESTRTSTLTIDVPFYLDTTWQKTFTGHYGQLGTATPLNGRTDLLWLNTAAITSLTIGVSGGSWAINTKAMLYGLT